MTRRKKVDPVEVSLRESLDREEAHFWRWLSRMKRAVNALDKSKKRLKALDKRLRVHLGEQGKGKDTPCVSST